MKKVTLGLVALLFASSVFALDFSVGAKGNIGMATTIAQFGDEKQETEPVFSGSLGAVVGLGFNEMFSLEPELMFHFGNGYSITKEVMGKDYVTTLT